MWLDILCLILIAVGALLGYKRGFMAQAGSVLGVVLGIVCCNVFAGRLAEAFTETTDDAATVMLNNVMAYIIIFVVAYITGRLVGSMFAAALKAMRLTPLNRIAGALFMPFEYLLALSILLNAWVGAFPSTELRSNITGVKAVVLNLAPKVLGSKTVTDVFSSLQDSLRQQSETMFDTEPEPEQP